jgi:capsular polysaccharide transport system permease protein
MPKTAPAASRPKRPFASLRSIAALVLREMSTTYGRSPGGYLWAILEPVGGIALFTLILSVGLKIRTPSLGDNFPLFYGSGILPFLLYQRLSARVAMAIPFSRALLFYPGVTFVDAILARFILTTLTQILVFYIVMAGIIWAFDLRVLLDVPSIVTSFAMAAALGLGVGCLNATLIPSFALWSSAWGILTTPLFFMSAVIYIYEELPPLGQQVLWYNPLVHVTGMMRRGFYPTYEAAYVSPLYVFMLSLGLMALGLVLLGRYHREVLNQ